MDELTLRQVQELALTQHSPCASVYLPTERKGQQTQQNPIRLRNLLDQAEEQLIAWGMRSPDARNMLQEARNLLEDSEFWRHQSEGLALFISPNQTMRFRLPLRFQESITIGHHFHLKPLFPLLTGDAMFYVLAISQNQLRLLRCTRDTFEEVHSPLLPQGEESILQYIEEQRQLQWHTQTGQRAGGERAAVFHGQSGQQLNYKDRIFEYFRLVVQAVHRLTGEAPLTPATGTAEVNAPTVADRPERRGAPPPPVVFVGVDYLFPIFQRANNNDQINLLDDFVAGNPDEHRVTLKDLHAAAWSVVEPYFDRTRQKAVELYREAAGVAPRRASNDLPDVVRAAHDGRVALAFTALDAHRWGRYDETTGNVEFHIREEPGDEDLLDAVAIHTFIHGGRVHVVPRDEMPNRSEVAAVMRY